MKRFRKSKRLKNLAYGCATSSNNCKQRLARLALLDLVVESFLTRRSAPRGALIFASTSRFHSVEGYIESDDFYMKTYVDYVDRLAAVTRACAWTEGCVVDFVRHVYTWMSARRNAISTGQSPGNSRSNGTTARTKRDWSISRAAWSTTRWSVARSSFTSTLPSAFPSRIAGCSV